MDVVGFLDIYNFDFGVLAFGVDRRDLQKRIRRRVQ